MKSGKRELNGIIVWKQYDRELSSQEVEEEIRALENEGLEFGKILNSETIIVMKSSDGLAFSKSHLRNVDVHWKRFVETDNQLNSIVQRLDHKKIEEWQ